MLGSHSPGGRTVTWSRNSSMPDSRSLRSLALYATSWKTCGRTGDVREVPLFGSHLNQTRTSCAAQLTSSVISVAMERPISWYCRPFPNGPSIRNRNLKQNRRDASEAASGFTVGLKWTGVAMETKPAGSEPTWSVPEPQ